MIPLIPVVVTVAVVATEGLTAWRLVKKHKEKQLEVDLYQNLLVRQRSAARNEDLIDLRKEANDILKELLEKEKKQKKKLFSVRKGKL